MSSHTFIENQLHNLENICELHKTVKDIHESLCELQPITIYKIGSKYIEILFATDSELSNDMEKLFSRMMLVF